MLFRCIRTFYKCIYFLKLISNSSLYFSFNLYLMNFIYLLLRLKSIDFTVKIRNQLHTCKTSLLLNLINYFMQILDTGWEDDLTTWGWRPYSIRLISYVSQNLLLLMGTWGGGYSRKGYFVKVVNVWQW